MIFLVEHWIKDTLVHYLETGIITYRGIEKDVTDIEKARQFNSEIEAENAYHCDHFSGNSVTHHIVPY